MNLRGCVTADVWKENDFCKGAALLKIASSTRYGRIAFGVLCDGKGDEQAAGEVALIAAEHLEKWFLHELPQILKEAESTLIEKGHNGMKARVITEVLAYETAAQSYSLQVFHEAREEIIRRLTKLTGELNIRIVGHGRLNHSKTGAVAVCLLVMGGEYLLMRIGKTGVYLSDSDNLKDLAPVPEKEEGSRTSASQTGLGKSAFVEPVFIRGTIRKGMGLLLCSDGFIRMQDYAVMHKRMRRSSLRSERRMNKMMQSLTKTVRKKGETDDVFAVYVACTE